MEDTMSQVNELGFTESEQSVFDELWTWVMDAALDVKNTGKASEIFRTGDGLAFWVFPVPTWTEPVDFRTENPERFEFLSLPGLPEAAIVTGVESDIRAFRALVEPLYAALATV